MENVIRMEQAEKTNLTLSSVEVAMMIEKEHKNLIRDIRNYVEILGKLKIEQSDFFEEGSYISSQNKRQPCYYLTRKGCEFISNKLTGEKGIKFTAIYINKFHEMEQKLVTHTDSYMIQDPIKRAKAWIVEEERRIQLTFEKDRLKEKILVDKPKTDLGNAIIEKGTNCLIKQLAIMITQTKKVSIGQNKLFAWLRENGYLCKSGLNRNMPTQRAIDMNLFEVKVSTRSVLNEKGVRVDMPNTPTTTVTPKGQAYFVSKAITGELVS